MMRKKLEPETDRIWRDWRYLCEELGERRAGTENEWKAAQFIEQRFRDAGLTDVHQEEFSCTSLKRESVKVEVLDSGQWREVECRCLVGAPATPKGKPVEGEIAWLPMPEAAHRLLPNSLAGKIVLLFGPLPTNVEDHKKLVGANPLAIIHIDERLPFNWAKNDGVYPLWAKRFGFPPTVTVPYMEAWQWRRRGLKKVRVGVELTQHTSPSYNVVGDLPGADPNAGTILVTAHHDTQCNNVGADDNTAGEMCVLELARLLSGRSLKRTLRFISFGTEEQLSVGSAAYALAHRKAMADFELVINFDAVASPLGHNWMYTIGSSVMADYAKQILAEEGVDVVPMDEVSPFSDHFPFSIFGVPSFWFFRANFPAGRWQHHSEHDNLENVSMDVLVELIEGTGVVIEDLANRDQLPFDRTFPQAQQTVVNDYARNLFGIQV